ncbi:2-C-methyl-D-erythritol 2,4-cyclodiphosphate synthase [Psychrobacter lutiphocae]|uniref:2-C-methyl-D-erythritol 2,4-cyclodiphosphate synthase n=1 Tax=Psychrobacter lutiphocae TaxID=540500 RepID=UPI00035F0E91|nr:2-C-methyl-D-erythritol 2,4-cyclodiphosphate synthase [Psychrobacter lutiphocae]
MIRIGQGLDVHAFYDKNKSQHQDAPQANKHNGHQGALLYDNKQQYVVLAGVKIPHDYSLKAHSDGDVVLHALADALLGALALGDIGQHFPDTDEANAGLDSRVLLRHVYTLVQQRGFKLINADITVICEHPKLAKHNFAMRSNIAEDLDTNVENISVKATTSEKLGFTGRGEGIAASAIVLIAKDS